MHPQEAIDILGNELTLCACLSNPKLKSATRMGRAGLVRMLEMRMRKYKIAQEPLPEESSLLDTER